MVKWPCFHHLVCGHVHRTISGSAAGVPFTILKSTCHQMPMVLGDGSSSLSIDEPGAYSIVLLGEDSVVACRENYELADAAEVAFDTASGMGWSDAHNR